MLEDLLRDWTIAFFCEGTKPESCLRRAKRDRPIPGYDTQVVLKLTGAFGRVAGRCDRETSFPSC